MTTTDEFNAKCGDAEELDSADFDFVSKVEPFQRALKECNTDTLITGQRMDQAAQRFELPVWEDGKRTFNPMASFAWSDIIAYVDARGVPVNRAHNFAFRCKAPIEATQRHLPDLPWAKVDLGKPFWKATDAELKGTPPVPITYVFKSFGDTHTPQSLWSRKRVSAQAASCGRQRLIRYPYAHHLCRCPPRWLPCGSYGHGCRGSQEACSGCCGDRGVE